MPIGAVEQRLLSFAVERGYLRPADAQAVAAELEAAAARAGDGAPSLLALLGRRCPGQVRELALAYQQLAAAARPPTGAIAPTASAPAPAFARTGSAAPPDAPTTASASDRTSPPASATTGRIGHYAILGELARGGMGVVYEARHVELERRVALKVLLSGERSAPKQRERFLLEARAAARLRHPNIVALHEVGEDAGRPYLVMDLAPGESLADRLERDGPLPEREAAELCVGVAEALHCAHDHLILHRDVKPANVLVGSDGAPLLTDFGLAKRLDADAGGPTRTGQLLGTPSYMPPEQLSAGAPIDARADVYALGATLYALLTGRPPFVEEQLMALVARVAEAPPEPPSRLRSGLSRDLETICLECLEKEPRDRYPSARAVADDLRRYLERRPIEARPPTPWERAWKWARRNRTVAGTGAAAAVALLLGGTIASVLIADAEAETQRARAATLEAEATAAEQADAARREAEAALVADARAEAEAAAAAHREAGALGTALAALQAAQRWRLAAPDDPTATRLQHDAALALGDLARATEQWDLAVEAYRQTEGLGVDDAAARARVESVHDARTAEARARRAAVADVLARAEAGELGGEAGLLDDAVERLVRHRHEETVAALGERLDALARELDAVKRSALRRALSASLEDGALRSAEDALWRAVHAPGAAALPADVRATLAGLGVGRVEAPEVLGRVAAAQADALGAGGIDLARVACRALGRFEIAPGAVAPLERYLSAEADPLRAVHAALALCRLGDRGRAIVEASLARFGVNTAFGRRAVRALRDTGHDGPTGSPPDAEPAGPSAAPETGPAPPSDDSGEELQALIDQATRRLRGGDAERAIAAFDAALRRAPDHPAVLTARGEARRAAGDLEGALADHGRALELDPGSARALLNRATVHEDRGDPAAARRDLDRALDLYPEHVAARIKRGLIRFVQGDAAGARRDLDRAIALDPDRAGAWTNRSYVRLATGDAVGAREDADRAIELDPEETIAWSHRGSARRALGDRSGALEDLSRAIELDPESALAWANRAAVRRELGEVHRARRDVEEALELAPDLPEALNTRAALRLAAGDLRGAVADADRALAGDPELAAAWNTRGYAKQDLGDLRGAIADFDRAIELEPGTAMLWTNRGTARAVVGDVEGALADFEEAIARDPQLAQGWFFRGKVRAYTGDPTGARSDFDRALELDPALADAWAERGALRHRAGDVAGAIRDYDRALELDPRNLTATNNRGTARYATGDLDGALADLERFLELAPGHPATGKVRELIAKIRRETGG